MPSIKKLDRITSCERAFRVAVGLGLIKLGFLGLDVSALCPLLPVAAAVMVGAVFTMSSLTSTKGEIEVTAELPRCCLACNEKNSSLEFYKRFKRTTPLHQGRWAESGVNCTHCGILTAKPVVDNVPTDPVLPCPTWLEELMDEQQKKEGVDR